MKIDLSALNENQKIQLVTDLTTLANEHTGTASNEHIWALGSETQEEAIQHETYASEHLPIAELYINLANEVDL